MVILGIDIGSSAVKAGVLRDGRLTGKATRVTFPTRHDGLKVEVEPGAVLAAVASAVGRLPAPSRRLADAIAFSVMSPSWVVMDARGEPLTPIVTHQDRRSVEEALQIEMKVGKRRHLKLCGNRPFPGGMTSTIWAWYRKHEPSRLKRADLVGQLSTFLVRRLTGRRVIDPSNASFTGVYSVPTLGGWCGELCQAVGLPKRLLPQIIPANHIAGPILPEMARWLGLVPGTPVLPGIVDGSSAMLTAGARVGQMVNVAGSTDVLAMVAAEAMPHERLITRALGVDGLILSVSTLAATGSALEWAHRTLMPDLPEQAFWALVGKLADRKKPPAVRFEPYLAGERTSVEQRQGAFAGLTLSTTRQDLLHAVVDALAVSSAARLELLRNTGTRITRRVAVAGGMGRRLSRVLHRDWGPGWTFVPLPDEATLLGLGRLDVQTG